MSGRHAVKSSKKPLIIVICAVVLVAVIAAVIILFMNLSGKNNNSTTTVPSTAVTVTTSESASSTQKASEAAETTSQSSSESSEVSQDPTEQGYTAGSSSNDNKIVVPTISGEDQKPKFSATLIPYYAKDENTSEEYSLKDLFGSAYSGGGLTFNEDGTFFDGITNSSVNSGAYIVEGDSVVITYSNDKNVIATVTEWNGDVPSEITLNYGGIVVSFK